jgi:hypothetical protein
VAANVGIVAAFENALNTKVIIPEYHDVMGAFGSALIAKQKMQKGALTRFYGFGACMHDYKAKSRECEGCSNSCEVIEIYYDDTLMACWGDKCGKWSSKTNQMDLSS